MAESFEEVTAGVFTQDEADAIVEYHTYQAHKERAIEILQMWTDKVLERANAKAVVDAMREVADDIEDVLLDGVDDDEA